MIKLRLYNMPTLPCRYPEAEAVYSRSRPPGHNTSPRHSHRGQISTHQDHKGQMTTRQGRRGRRSDHEGQKDQRSARKYPRQYRKGPWVASSSSTRQPTRVSGDHRGGPGGWQAGAGASQSTGCLQFIILFWWLITFFLINIFLFCFLHNDLWYIKFYCCIII